MMTTLRMARPDDVDGFLQQLKTALVMRLDPATVDWDDGALPQHSLLADTAESATEPLLAADDAPIALPRGLLALIRTVALHDDPARYRLMHTLAFATLQNRAAWTDSLNPLRLQLERMARQVRREIHKMHAFVRFRVVEADSAAECRVAWFEPAHHIVRAAAPFFVNRFAAMHWAILTPRGCAYWNRQTLAFGPPASPAEAPKADDGEALWLAYYRSIFNPARIKVAMMQREMPGRFWKNLPEAAQITALLQAAHERTFKMETSTDGQRQRRRSSTLLHEKQHPRPHKQGTHDGQGHPFRVQEIPHGAGHPERGKVAPVDNSGRHVHGDAGDDEQCG